MIIKAKIKPILLAALEEDIRGGDITTQNIISPNSQGEAFFLVKQTGVVAGLDVARQVFATLHKGMKWLPLVKDGDAVSAGTLVARVSGNLQTLLTGERTALNFMQRMSGIATLTSKYVAAVVGTGAAVLDTRKTAPGHRYLDKYAVACGGGHNHRMGLYDLVMIKDNHICAAGGLTKAVAIIQKKIKRKIKIEVEAATLSQVAEALAAGVDIIMLDNMSVRDMKKAVKVINKQCLVEASGGVSLSNIRTIARTGVDYISVGTLTHSAPALDISMKIKF